MSDRLALPAVAPARTILDELRSTARHLAAFCRERRGVAMVEFAVTLPILVGLLLPLVDLGMGFYRKTQLMTAAEAGAQYAWRHGYNLTKIKTIVQDATSLGSTVVPLTDITAPLSCKCVDKTTNQFTATSPAITPTKPSDCTGTTACSTVANSISATPGAYVTVTINPNNAPAHNNYTPLFTYWIFGGGIKLTVTSTVRID